MNSSREQWWDRGPNFGDCLQILTCSENWSEKDSENLPFRDMSREFLLLLAQELLLMMLFGGIYSEFTLIFAHFEKMARRNWSCHLCSPVVLITLPQAAFLHARLRSTHRQGQPAVQVNIAISNWKLEQLAFIALCIAQGPLRARAGAADV